MEFEITPEPTPEERTAIVAALSRVLADGRDAPSPWWEAGVREAIEDDEGLDYPAGRLRSKRGAARA